MAIGEMAPAPTVSGSLWDGETLFMFAYVDARRLSLSIIAASGLAACASSGGGHGGYAGGGYGAPGSGVTPSPHQKTGSPYTVNGITYRPAADPGYDRRGVASWYGRQFHGRLTANGELFDMNQFTAAHPTLPLPSILEVTNLENGRRIEVRVNDRGPFAKDRIIDLSRASAQALGMLEQGTARVRVRYVRPAPMNEAVMAFKAPPREPAKTRVADNHRIRVGVDPNGDFYVQAAAYADAQSAKRVARTLSRYAAAETSPTIRPDGLRLHRVRLGPFGELEAAAGALGAVRGAGFPDAELVMRD